MRRAIEQLVVFFLAIGTATTVLMVMMAGLAPLAALSVGIVAGQLGAVLLVAVAASINPLSWRYVRDLQATSPRYEGWLATPEDRTARLSAYEMNGFHYVMSAVDAANVEPDAEDYDDHVVDVVSRTDRSAFVAVSRGSGATLVMSLMNDGRALVTTSVGIPPHSSLIVNRVNDALPDDLLESHAATRDILASAGFDVVEGGSGLYPWVMMVEWRAYGQLGMAACLADPIGGFGPLRFEIPARKALLLGIESPPEVLSGRQAPVVVAR